MTIDAKVLERIREVGYVDNFYCIDNRITTRLAATIHKLEKTRSPLMHISGSDILGASEKNYYYVKPTRIQRIGDKYKLI